MERFVHDENVRRFRDLIARETDPAKRAQLQRLLEEEEKREIQKREDKH